MRHGQIGEILVLIALLASAAILTLTFTDSTDVANVPHETVKSLRDVRDALSRAVIAWLETGSSTEVMACNGVYPLDTDASDLEDAFRPYAENAITEVDGDPGDLASIDFGDIEGLTISMANGSIVYADDLIYAEDNYDKSYDFDVRLLLVLKVAQDWLRCDAGNLTTILGDSFGDRCFFGKKDTGYPGFCLDESYQILPHDREYMLQYAPNTETVGAATQEAIDTLNGYFAGETYCEERVVTEDTGISCRYELSQLSFEYEMYPYREEHLALPFYDSADYGANVIGSALELGDTEYRSFWRLDTHVFALPSRVFIGKYDDEELKTADVSCADEGREPVVTPYDGVDARGRPEMVDVATGTSTIDAKPILYVNTSKGAKFTVKVTCTDTRASLLGQPLEYSFSFRHGVRATCGPRSWLLGTYDCGACLPRAAHDLKCKTAYSGCGKESTCRDGMIWKWRFEDKLDFPEGVNGDAVVQAMYNSGKQEYLDLLSMMNDTCAGIVGLPAYPILGPKAMIGSMKACERPYKYVCCTTPGFKEDCSETGDINNQECFMSAAENLAWCTTDIKCGESECGDSLCVEPDGCLPPTIDVGRRCRDGCTACNKEGVCVASADLENLQCDTQYTDSCMKYTCQGGVCKGALSSDIGDSCHIDGVRDTDPCGKYACSSSGCTYGPLSPLPTAPCDEQEVDRGDKICTQKYYCSPNGYCTPSNTDSDCKPKGGGGGTCDPKTNDGCNTPP